MAYRRQNYSGPYGGYDNSMYMGSGMSPAEDAMMERKIIDVLVKMLGNSMNVGQGMDNQYPYTNGSRNRNQERRRRKKKGQTEEDETAEQNEKNDDKEKGATAGKKSPKPGSQRMSPRRDRAKFEPRTFCYICSLECRSEKDLEFHLSGKRHKLAVEGSDKIVGRPDRNAKPFCKFCCVQFTEDDWATHKETPEHKAKTALKVKVPRYSSEPEGVEFIVPTSGFYCKLCHRFYTDEETAKSNHCKSREHLQRIERDKLVRQYDSEMKDYLAKKKTKKAEEAAAKEAENDIQQADQTTEQKSADDEESAVKDEYRKVNSE